MPAPKSRAVRRRELGSRLRSLRTASGLSSQQVADSLGVSRWKIGRLETGVKARMERQHLLRAPEPPAFTAVLDESVLHRVVESPAVMLAQLRKLLETSRLPHVSIRVVPFDAGVVPATALFDRLTGADRETSPRDRHVAIVLPGRPGTRSGALISLVDAEHALGYSGDLDLAPDRATLREFVVAPQRGEAAQPAGPARVRRVGGVEPALHHGEPGLAVRAFQFPAVGHAVGEPQRRLAARLELDEPGPPGSSSNPPIAKRPPSEGSMSTLAP